jgi:hypothetical protein
MRLIRECDEAGILDSSKGMNLFLGFAAFIYDS